MFVFTFLLSSLMLFWSILVDFEPNICNKEVAVQQLLKSLCVEL